MARKPRSPSKWPKCARLPCQNANLPHSTCFTRLHIPPTRGIFICPRILEVPFPELGWSPCANACEVRRCPDLVESAPGPDAVTSAPCKSLSALRARVSPAVSDGVSAKIGVSDGVFGGGGVPRALRPRAPECPKSVPRVSRSVRDT